MNEEETLKCLKLSKNLFSEGDFEGALRLAIKAQRMMDSTETREWLEKVKSSDNSGSTSSSSNSNNTSDTGISNTSDSSNTTDTGNIRKRHVKTEEVKIEEFTSTTTTTTKSEESTAAYTSEQLKEVKEFMKKNKEDYYSILGVEKTASQDELKKAYKKLALKFHPDKNQAPGADEAFKTISVAFSVLGDEEKRRNFDRFGGVSSGNPAGGNNPFASPFSAHFASPGGFSFHESGEISPEELFNLFFNAAFSQANQQQQGNPFVFFSSNFQGPQGQQRQQRYYHQRQGHQRQGHHRQGQNNTENEDLLRKFIQFIPLIIVFFLSIVSSWMFPSETPSNVNVNDFSLNASSKHRYQRSTRSKNVPYYVTLNFQKHFSNISTKQLSHELGQYENIIETSFIKELKKSCDLEQRQLAKLLKKAKKDEIEEIKNNFKLNYCEKMKKYE